MQTDQPRTGTGRRDETVIEQRPRDPNWLGVGAESGEGRPAGDSRPSESGDERPGRTGRDPQSREAPPSRDAPRTLGNHPGDPNSIGAGVDFPPGVDSRTAADPGNQTPGAPKVTNRS
ncbi:hypothetical protein GCM10023144_03000 [Pigmentiphaga soli]|uniref:Uncharacterized protein n=1 Tax=Pigmentiphaga soli TaxID=1007095 RepID=A0ABP8GE88_9BURK